MPVRREAQVQAPFAHGGCPCSTRSDQGQPFGHGQGALGLRSDTSDPGHARRSIHGPFSRCSCGQGGERRIHGRGSWLGQAGFNTALKVTSASGPLYPGRGAGADLDPKRHPILKLARGGDSPALLAAITDAGRWSSRWQKGLNGLARRLRQAPQRLIPESATAGRHRSWPSLSYKQDAKAGSSTGSQGHGGGEPHGRWAIRGPAERALRGSKGSLSSAFMIDKTGAGPS